MTRLKHETKTRGREEREEGGRGRRIIIQRHPLTPRPLTDPEPPVGIELRLVLLDTAQNKHTKKLPDGPS